MKKKLLAVVLSAAMALTLIAGCGKNPTSTSAPSKEGGNTTSTATTTENAYEYDITVWVPELAVELTQKQIENFNNTNTDGIKLNPTIEAVSEADAATQMITDVEAGADIFNFAQDQIARLIQAGALAQLGEQAAATVKEINDDSAVAAVTAGDSLYAYPITSDNGYYMFYDKSVIKEENLGSMEALMENCKEAGRTFCFELGGSAWYTAAFFFATGCDSTWVTDDNGEFISVNDTYNSDNGLKAIKGLYKIITSDCWIDSSEVTQFEAAIPAAVVVSGPWNNATAGDILGENLGAVELPSFEVDGQSFHLNSFSGNKLMGVKPQTDPAKAACLSKLAQYLTGEECQKQRFDELQWGPSNKALQETDAVKSNVGLAALAAQAPYARPQGNIHGSWWDIGKAITAEAKESDGSDEALKAVLQNYFDKCSALFNMTSDEKEAFSVIGSIGGDGWTIDIPMTRTGEIGAATYYTDLLELKAGEEFKVRQGGSWDVNFGNDGTVGGPNCLVDADGFYFIKLVVNDDLTEGIITLEKTSWNEWSAIGTLNGSNWDTDFALAISEDGKTYKLEGVEMAAGTEFKVRKAASWNENYGADGAKDGSNIKVEADGTYTIVFDSETHMITLE